MPTFWNLQSPESVRGLAEWDKSVELEQVVCRLNPGHMRGGRRLNNLSLLLPRSRPKDFVWTWQSECLIQDYVLQVFRKKGFTGFDVNPVTARFKTGLGHPPRLWELVVTGWAGLAPPESGIRLTEYCPGCRFAHYSGLMDADRLIDPARWDGADFFTVWPMASFILVTDRVAACIQSHAFSGAVLKDVRALSGIGLDSGLGGGRLSYWMPESRARELGKEFGILEV